MRQVKFFSLGMLSLTLALALCGTITGCGGGPETSEVTVPPEVRKADDAGQNAMRDMMQSKGKTKSAAKK